MQAYQVSKFQIPNTKFQAPNSKKQLVLYKNKRCKHREIEPKEIKSAMLEFEHYKTLGDKTFAQLEEKDIHWTFSESDNSIAIIAKHMAGNMLSRWTNFLTEDGEKLWRNRETEFEDPYKSKLEMAQAWEEGWHYLFKALKSINPDNFDSEIKIRNEAHTIFEAVNRQLAHCADHVGQIVFIGKVIKGNEWVSLSIHKGASEEFNKEKLALC